VSRGGIRLSEADTAWLIRNSPEPVQYVIGSHVWLAPGQPEALLLLQQHWMNEYIGSYA
jgi:hypothetical protein